VVEPKTVSNLPLDVSTRWAEDQKILEESSPLIRESGIVPQHAQAEVILPAPQSQMDILLGLVGRHPTWAVFQMPQGFTSQRRRLFTSKLIPFLESDEQQDTLMARIEGVSGEEPDRESSEREKNCLLQLLKLLHSLNKDLIDIMSRCKQYQKG
jgi:hypothetical protein